MKKTYNIFGCLTVFMFFPIAIYSCVIENQFWAIIFGSLAFIGSIITVILGDTIASMGKELKR